MFFDGIGIVFKTFLMSKKVLVSKNFGIDKSFGIGFDQIVGFVTHCYVVPVSISNGDNLK